MDQSQEVTNIKNKLTELTSSNQLEIKTETQLDLVNHDNYYLIHSQFDIKTESQEYEDEFSVIASTSYDTHPNYNVKIETEDPLIKIESGDILDEILHDPLDVDNKIKVGKHFSVNLEEFGRSEAKIKTELIEEEKDENLSESDENTESHRSTSNFQQQLIRNNPVSKDKKYICNECNKTFRWKSYLDRHLRIHTGEKPYNCNVCKKSFTQNQHLDGHMLIHSGEKPHSCDLCKKVFSRKSHLDLHKLIHSGTKQFSCDVCKKSFAQKQDLVKHKRIHTGEKPYTCGMCDKAFIQISDLTRHRRLHTGEKPFSCDVCNKSFTRNSTLKEHKKLHKN